MSSDSDRYGPAELLDDPNSSGGGPEGGDGEADPTVGSLSATAAPPSDGGSGGGRRRLTQDHVEFASRVVVVLCCLYVFLSLHPLDILSSSTPTGGDMGAHVWGPHYLWSELLPSLRLSGWTPDWYAGFPAYTFYMVVPSLAIVILDIGLPVYLGIPAVIGLGYVATKVIAWPASAKRTAALWGLGAAALLSIDLSYGAAFKLVVVSGIVLLPAAIWYLCRGLDMTSPGPELAAVLSLFFLFDDQFTIYGGNVASTMAGEFAFSISLMLSIVFLGEVARGVRHGGRTTRTAVLFAAAAMCHVIPMFFAVVTAVIILLTQPSLRGLRWLVSVGGAGGLVALVWYAPFYLNSTYLHDMGWEKLGMIAEPNACAVQPDRHIFLRYLFPFGSHIPDAGGNPVVDPNMAYGRVFFILAGIGLIFSIAYLLRGGIVFSLITLVSGAAFVLMPQHRFWNARVLPFYYLGIYLGAAVGVWTLALTVVAMRKGRLARPSPAFSLATVGLGVLVVYVALGMLLRDLVIVPVPKLVDGGYRWLVFETRDQSNSVGWARWNFKGLEDQKTEDNPGGKEWAEFKGFVDEFARIGEERGCGRSLWEYDKTRLESYGTPMAPMLLPYFTSSCIGSMEGLYFEASTTTPYHFILQDEASEAGSRAQRWDHLDGFSHEVTTGDGADAVTTCERYSPFTGFDLNAGVQHMQELGVRYYAASTDRAKTAAAADPRLELVGSSGPWEIYEVREVATDGIVVPMTKTPVVWDGADQAAHAWVRPAVDVFEHPETWESPPAADGPADWPRIPWRGGGKLDPWPDNWWVDDLRGDPVDPTTVSNIEVGRESLSFDVSEVGKPVLVKVSYFPAWSADGADGPYRVAPNQMVVVPTSTHVSLSYGRTTAEYLGWLAFVLGIIAIVAMSRSRWYAPWPLPGRTWLGDRELIDPRPRRGASTDGSDSDDEPDPDTGLDPAPEPDAAAEPDPAPEPAAIEVDAEGQDGDGVP